MYVGKVTVSNKEMSLSLMWKKSSLPPKKKQVKEERHTVLMQIITN
jgi:hypothetical protein